SKAVLSFSRTASRASSSLAICGKGICLTFLASRTRADISTGSSADFSIQGLTLVCAIHSTCLLALPDFVTPHRRFLGFVCSYEFCQLLFQRFVLFFDFYLRAGCFRHFADMLRLMSLDTCNYFGDLPVKCCIAVRAAELSILDYGIDGRTACFTFLAFSLLLLRGLLLGE